ncbi:MAG TPA: sugar ABC transporter permease, partial [Clostridia bacterium]|nr:sugar ABC transporter permease [Clostridia bacterium]
MQTTIVAHKKTPLLRRMWSHRYIYLLLLPALVFMALFHYFPMYGVQIAFKKYSAAHGIWDSPWYGLYYFRRMFR